VQNQNVIPNPLIKEDLYLNGDDINKCVILSAAKNPEKNFNPESSGFFTTLQNDRQKQRCHWQRSEESQV